MRKSIITALCALGLVISTPAMALTVKSNAPKRYVVKKGDTLWDISRMYLRNPWQWSKLWGMNKSQVKNPHRIYPGQVLVLTYVNGQPRLGFEGGASGDGATIKLSPGAHDTSRGYSIATLPESVLRNFMNYPSIVSEAELSSAPRLIAGPDKHLMYSIGDRVYARNLKEDGRYLTYRVNPINPKVLDPKTKELLGYEIVYSGEVATLHSRTGGPKVKQTYAESQILPKDQRYTQHAAGLVKIATDVATPMEITKTVSEISEGDYLTFLPEDSHDRFNFAPHEPFAEIDAKILRIFDGVSEAGQYQTILLNKGELNGLDRGTVVTLYKDRTEDIRKRWERKDSKATLEYTALPIEQIGTALVYKSFDRLAYAIVVDSVSEVRVGDLATNPDRDMEDMRPDRDAHTPVKQ